MKERRLLFHFHTYYSFDASITLRQLARVVEKHEITHVAITEHNNLKSYRPELVNGIDLYEAVNLRGADKSFDRRPWRGKNHIFAADAHNFFDLPGIINLYPGGGETIDVIRRETPFPLIARDDLRLTNRLSKLASKLKKRVHPYLPF